MCGRAGSRRTWPRVISPEASRFQSPAWRSYGSRGPESSSCSPTPDQAKAATVPGVAIKLPTKRSFHGYRQGQEPLHLRSGGPSSPGPGALESGASAAPYFVYEIRQGVIVVTAVGAGRDRLGHVGPVAGVAHVGSERHAAGRGRPMQAYLLR